MLQIPNAKILFNFSGSLGILVMLQNYSLYNNFGMYFSCTERKNNKVFVKEVVSEGLFTMSVCPLEFREY